MGYIGSDPKTNQSVSTSQLVNDSVTNEKIVDDVQFNSVTASFVSSSTEIVGKTFTGTFSGALSSSAQIASTISGSFTADSSSFSTRVSDVEAGSTSKTLVSSSILSSPSQGTIRLATNGVNTDVDSGLQTGDSPTFTAITVNTATVTGTLTAQEIRTEFESASILFTSGSTIFGNSSDDVHNMTGSLNVSGSLTLNDGTLTVTDNVDFNGDLDVDGTTNLDAVDIDGNVDLAGVLTTAGSTSSNYVGSFTNTSAQGWGLFIKGGADNADYTLRVQDKDAGDLLSVKSGGNIGIGTNDPSDQLTISNSGEASLAIIGSAGSGGGDATLYLVENTTDYGIRMRYDGGDDKLYINADENTRNLMTIKRDGSGVGIGTTSPDNLLHIKTTGSTPSIELEQDAGTSYKALFKLAGNDLEIRGSSGAMEFYNGGNNDGDSSTLAMTIDNSQVVTFASTILVPEYIKHDGDTNTNLRFLSDRIILNAGGNNMIDCDGGTITVNHDAQDIDFIVETTGNSQGFHVDAGNNVVNINRPIRDNAANSPDEVLALKTFYPSAATDGNAGAGSLLSFYIPDDETNPALGGGVACVRESDNDSDMSSGLQFYTSGNDTSITPKMYLNSSGYVGIGGAPSVNFHVMGHDPHIRITDTTGTTEFWNISVGQAADGRLQIDDSDNDNGVYMNQNDTSWTSSSDERLKTNWTTFDDALSSINSLTKVGTFQYTKSIEDQTPKNDVVHSGLSAQEVQKFLPSSVSENNDGILGLQYQHLIPVLVKAVQELSAKVEALEST